MFKDSPDLIFLYMGMGAAAMSAFARRASNNMKEFFSWKGLALALTDALSCSLITSGITLSLHEYYGASLVYSIGVGTFVGTLGYKTILVMLQGFFAQKFHLDNKK